MKLMKRMGITDVRIIRFSERKNVTDLSINRFRNTILTCGFFSLKAEIMSIEVLHKTFTGEGFNVNLNMDEVKSSISLFLSIFDVLSEKTA